MFRRVERLLAKKHTFQNLSHVSRTRESTLLPMPRNCNPSPPCLIFLRVFLGISY